MNVLHKNLDQARAERNRRNAARRTAMDAAWFVVEFDAAEGGFVVMKEQDFFLSGLAEVR